MSTYNAFDNNPVLIADPSGADGSLTNNRNSDPAYGAKIIFGGINKTTLTSKKTGETIDINSDSSGMVLGADNAGKEPNDWVKKKGSKKYVWQENVTFKTDSDLSSDYEYIGKTLADVNAPIKKNASILESLKLWVGSSSYIIDYKSYNSAKVKPFLDEVFLNYKNRKGIDFGEYEFNRNFLYFNQDKDIASFNYYFNSPNGRILATGLYKYSDFDFVNLISFGKYESKTVHANFGNNSILVGIRPKKKMFILNLPSKKEANSLQSYFNKND